MDRLLIACMAIALLLMTAVASAEGTATPECRPQAVHDDGEGALLTREEKIARMDEALHDSLARFEQCRQGVASDSAGGTRRGAAGGDVAGNRTRAGSRANGADRQENGEGGSQAGTAIESVAASGIQGTEVPAPDTPSSGMTTSETEPLAGGQSGPVPKDILAMGRNSELGPDNDSKLEAQIRLAAMNETDPQQKARLWNEYRRYKGLPLKPMRKQGDADAQEESE